jgi:urea transporter
MAYNQCTARPMGEMVWWALIISNLAFGFLVSFVISWSDTRSIMAGAKVAGIVGLLVAVSIDLSIYSMSNTFPGFTPVIVDILVYTFMAAVCGIVISWVMSLAKKEA